MVDEEQWRPPHRLWEFFEEGEHAEEELSSDTVGGLAFADGGEAVGEFDRRMHRESVRGLTLAQYIDSFGDSPVFDEDVMVGLLEVQLRAAWVQTMPYAAPPAVVGFLSDCVVSALSTKHQPRSDRSDSAPAHCMRAVQSFVQLFDSSESAHGYVQENMRHWLRASNDAHPDRVVRHIHDALEHMVLVAARAIGDPEFVERAASRVRVCAESEMLCFVENSARRRRQRIPEDGKRFLVHTLLMLTDRAGLYGESENLSLLSLENHQDLEGKGEADAQWRYQVALGEFGRAVCASRKDVRDQYLRRAASLVNRCDLLDVEQKHGIVRSLRAQAVTGEHVIGVVHDVRQYVDAPSNELRRSGGSEYLPPRNYFRRRK